MGTRPGQTAFGIALLRQTSSELRHSLMSTMENGVTVAKMASAMRMGLHCFAQKLRRSAGRSPYQFVQMRRIQLAKRFLQQNSGDLAAISARLGFASPK